MVGCIDNPSTERHDLTLVVVLHATAWSLKLVVRGYRRLGHPRVVDVETVRVEGYPRKPSFTNVLSGKWRAR
jgi:hypothetical protein